MGWREDRRLDRAAAGEQVRRNAQATAKVEAMRARSRLELEREEKAAKAENRRRVEREKDARWAKRRARWRGLWAGVCGWLAGHVVDLLIYPLAVVSAVMAIPAMAGYGRVLYGDLTGVALPAITELGMWAFALAVQVSRHRSPGRPVWALQLGTWAFCGVAFTINALHGLESGPVDGFVMGVVSVAGVVAHQLVTAAPRRSRTERDLARAARRARRKLADVRRAAVREAVAQIDDTGNARLVFTPGFYDLAAARRSWRRWFATTPALTEAPAPGGDALDRELAALLADPAAVLDSHPGRRREIGPDSGRVSGGLGTLDPSSDHRPDSRPDRRIDSRGDQRGSTSTPGRRSGRQRVRKSSGPHRRPARSIEELRTELDAKLAADPASIDVSSAESIRRALHCAPKAARQLRDEYRNH